MPPLLPEDPAAPPNRNGDLPRGFEPASPVRWPRRLRLIAITLLGIFAVLLVIAVIAGRLWLRNAITSSLPQISGTLHTAGLAEPVTVHRSDYGVPSIAARRFDDLLFAQGFVTAQDRLFQMDTLRRHAAGQLAEILGKPLLEHDRSQRVLSLGAAADRILAQLPAEQRHAYDRYAAGVNASIALQSDHLPVEFRVLAYQPRPWTARDCALVSLVLFEDLTNSFPAKLEREALEAHLAPDATPEMRRQLLADLYPVGSWRDHPPSQAIADVTAPLESLPEIPLDDTQVRLRSQPASSPVALAALHQSLRSPFPTAAGPCPECRAGSNIWAVSGDRTASGKPVLSNDMHLAFTAPGIWYAVDLASVEGVPGAASVPFHVAGVSLPGVPYVVAGHNEEVAWGFTNLGADVQDLYIEHLRSNDTEFRTADGQWQPVTRRREHIRVRGGADVTLDVAMTQHFGLATPILTPLLKGEHRPIALCWSLFDTAGFSLPFAAMNAAADGAALIAAVNPYTGPTQNLVYADSAGHIGYHAIGRIPIRGQLTAPATLSPTPIDTALPDAAAHEWVGFIPFNELPSTVDPAGGLIATANSRVTPDNYPYPVTLDWVSPYRTERIYHVLTGAHGLQPADMLRLQTDVYSDSDKLIAHRFAYAIDNTANATKQLRRAADLLRSWDGQVLADTPAPAIVSAARTALWRLLLEPKLASPASQGAANSPEDLSKLVGLYSWGERDTAQEQLVTHQPARWLPSSYTNWDDLFSAAVARGLADLHASSDPGKLKYGHAEPTEVELPLFAQSALLRRLLGMPTGTPVLALSGNGRTVRQTGHNFGPSERLTTTLTAPAAGTLVLPLGQSGDPASSNFRDQLPIWLAGGTLPLPFGLPDGSAASTLHLEP